MADKKKKKKPPMVDVDKKTEKPDIWTKMFGNLSKKNKEIKKYTGRDE